MSNMLTNDQFGTRAHYGIAVFHNIGDILLCTPIARQLKVNDPDCHIVWYTADKYKFILENNPYIDEIIALPGEPVALDNEIPRLKAEQNWTRFITPAPYMNYDKVPGGTLIELAKAGAEIPVTVPFILVFRLTPKEQESARIYWASLPQGKKVLVETEFRSSQSPWTDAYAFDMLEALRDLEPVFIFTSKNKPSFFEQFAEQYPKTMWCNEPFRLNAEFINLCDAYIGVSSGISCLGLSDYCRPDLPRIEVSRGEHWSAAQLEHLTELQICYSGKRFREALQRLSARLGQISAVPDFSPRFTTLAKLSPTMERVPCLLCGSSSSRPFRGMDIVQCNDCGFIYLRDRMTRKEMEQYYQHVYAVNNPNAAGSVRVPPSVEAVDSLPEFIGAQRRIIFGEAISAYGRNIQGKNLIDIGCGWGGLLHYARHQGMNVVGFEFTQPNVEFGRNKLHLDIRQQQFIDSDIPESSIDIVIMSHSLEHVPYPFEFVEKIAYVLKPGGIFYCVVPNIDSLCSQVLLEKWTWLEREWHYSHFTPKVLRELFAQTGFITKRCYTTSGDYVEQEVLSIIKQTQPQADTHQLQAILKEINSKGHGEEVRIIGRKRGGSQNRVIISPKNILWLRTDSIGDNVLASSMLPHIRKKYPQAKITVLCQEHIAELYETRPYIDEIITFNRIRAYQDENYRNEMLAKIRALNSDLALNSVYSREPLTDFFSIGSNAKERIAFKGDLCNIPEQVWDENNKYYSRLLEIDVEYKSELDRHRDFIKGLGIEATKLQPLIWLTPEDEKFAEEFFRDNKLLSEQTIALFTGVQQNTRFYEHYGSAIANALKDKQFTIIAFGATEDRAINQSNLDSTGMRSINLSGELTLRQTAALLKRCCLAVGAETGLAHVSCAVGIPNVILLGGGQFGRFMPYSPLTSVVSLPLECYKCSWYCKYRRVYCVRDILPEVFAEAIRQTLNGQSNKRRVFVQGKSLWNPKAGQPEWEWFDRYLDINSVEIIPVGKVPEIIDADKEQHTYVPIFDEIEKINNLLGFGKFEEANTALKQAIEKYPDTLELFNLQAVLKIQVGDIEGAKEVLLNLTKRWPGYFAPYNNLACIFWDSGDFENAVKYFEDALRISNFDRSVVFSYGDMLMSFKKYARAKEIYEEYLKINPDDTEIHSLLQKTEGVLEKVRKLGRVVNSLPNI